MFVLVQLMLDTLVNLNSRYNNFQPTGNRHLSNLNFYNRVGYERGCSVPDKKYF